MNNGRRERRIVMRGIYSVFRLPRQRPLSGRRRRTQVEKRVRPLAGPGRRGSGVEAQERFWRRTQAVGYGLAAGGAVPIEVEHARETGRASRREGVGTYGA